ncbi:MAG TPA: hypothetical protein PKH07_10515, partial [bacterium]|nr:hypothetical protein [bacterium]
SSVYSVAFSPDGTKILTGANLWDATTGALIQTLEGHTGTVTSVAFSREGREIITGGTDGQTLVWELNPPRAIIVAGGGDYSGNSIAQQTDDLGAYAYKTLKRRGYEAQDILYLSAFGPTDPSDPTKPFRDADDDGLNDVDGWSTLGALQAATTGTFAQDAGRLMIILIDHGFITNSGCYFQMNPTQVLPAATLDNWLDDLQAAKPVDVTLVVDACYSGGFVETCKGGVGGHKRIVISSTSSDTVATFLPPPDMTSFMYTFLGSAYMGNSMGESWRAGRQFFEEFPVGGQIPQLDDDSSGTDAADREFFGASWAYGVHSTQDVNDFFPVFDTWMSDGVVAPGTPVTLWTKTLSGQDPLGVVAVVRPPAPPTISGDAVTNLPHVALINSSTDTRLWYATTTDVFTTTGQHVISITARMPYERLSKPVFSRITVSEGTDADTTPIRAILAVGNTFDPDLHSAFAKLGPYAYSVYLDRFQDSGGVHHPEWIEYYINPFIHPESDGYPSSSAVLNAIDAVGSDIGRLYVHLIGDSPGAGLIEMANGDDLSASDLDSKLDAYQVRSVTGTVILVVDCPYSGSFLSVCKATGAQQRVLMTSGRSTDTALFSKSTQATSFSQKLLGAAYRGNHLRAGFTAGLDFLLTFLQGYIEPQIDDNGDGVSNKFDGQLAQTLFLGRRYAYAGGEASDLPFVLDVYPEHAGATAGSEVGFTARLMEGVEPARVFAQIVPSDVGSVTEPITSLVEYDFLRDREDAWTWSGSVIVPASEREMSVAVYASYPDGATQEKLT